MGRFVTVFAVKQNVMANFNCRDPAQHCAANCYDLSDAGRITRIELDHITKPANMYDRFTDRARKVMQLANQETQRFNHEYIGTEHILLGLVKEGTGVAALVLKSFDVDLRKIELEVDKLVERGPERAITVKLPQACLLYTSPSPRDLSTSRMPSSA